MPASEPTENDRLSRLEAIVEALAKDITAIKTAVSGVGRMDWQAIGVIITLVSVLGAMAVMPIREKMTDLDTTLQREMRLLDSTMEAEIGHLNEGREANQQWLIELDRRVTRAETLMESKP